MIVWVTRHCPLEYNRCGSTEGCTGMEQRHVWELRTKVGRSVRARWVEPSRVNNAVGVFFWLLRQWFGDLLYFSTFCYICPSKWSRSVFVLFSRMRNLPGTPLQVRLPLLPKMTRKMASSSAGEPTPSATHLWRNASPSRASQTARARLRCTDNSL